jgi:hypothetical protein
MADRSMEFKLPRQARAALATITQHVGHAEAWQAKFLILRLAANKVQRSAV